MKNNCCKKNPCIFYCLSKQIYVPVLGTNCKKFLLHASNYGMLVFIIICVLVFSHCIIISLLFLQGLDRCPNNSVVSHYLTNILSKIDCYTVQYMSTLYNSGCRNCGTGFSLIFVNYRNCRTCYMFL